MSNTPTNNVHPLSQLCMRNTLSLLMAEHERAGQRLTRASRYLAQYTSNGYTHAADAMAEMVADARECMAQIEQDVASICKAWDLEVPKWAAGSDRWGVRACRHNGVGEGDAGVLDQSPPHGPEATKPTQDR